jgi:hypothetical protein
MHKHKAEEILQDLQVHKCGSGKHQMQLLLGFQTKEEEILVYQGSAVEVCFQETEELCAGKWSDRNFMRLKKPLSTMLSGFFCEFLHNHK